MIYAELDQIFLCISMKGFVDMIFIDMDFWFYELDGVGLGVWAFGLFMCQVLLRSRMVGFRVWCGCCIGIA